MMMKSNNTTQTDNEIIAYINGKAIIKNEFDSLFFIEIPEEFVTIGETAYESDMTPVSELSESEQAEIKAVLK